MKCAISSWWVRLLGISFVLTVACVDDPDEHMDEILGFVPVYSAPGQSELKVVSPITVKNPGKIYVYNSFLLVNEINRGIHVFDNSEPSQPKPVAFIQLIGNSDLAIKDGILYADQMGDLVALTIGNFESVEERGRLPLSSWNLGLPPPSFQYFECIDPSKGLVIAWRSERIAKPECYAH
jgi:hypothetical protein